MIFKTYPQTPPETAKQIIGMFSWRKGETVLEPCRGKGAFYRQLPQFVKKQWCEILEGRNFFDYRGSVDSIITNPPYDNLIDFLEKSMQVAEERIIFLLDLLRFNSLTVKRLQKWENGGWEWDKKNLHVIEIKGWRNRYFVVTFKKKKLTDHWGQGKRNFNIVTDDSQEWYTPKYILDALGQFDLDPCSPLVRPFDTARKHYTKLDDGLCKPWRGRVWLNAPYKEVQTWMLALARHGNGIALTFSRLGTHWFEKVVMPYTTGLLVLTGHLKFIPKEGEASTAPHSSVLIAYDPLGTSFNNSALRNSGLPGSFFDRRLRID